MTESFYSATLQTGNGSGFFITVEFKEDGAPQDTIIHEGVVYDLIAVDERHQSYVYDPVRLLDTPRRASD